MLVEGVHHVSCDLFLGKAVFGLGRNVLGARGSWFYRLFVNFEELGDPVWIAQIAQCMRDVSREPRATGREWTQVQIDHIIV
jgi:hypothetical protein